MGASDLIDRLAQSVTSAQNLEALTRPLLEMLEEVTGLESTYLTMIDLPAGLQHVLYARNSRAMQIPEGLSVPWEDTLCKRALDEGRPFTNDVGTCWGDSEAAQALGIRTYLSTPVYAGENALYGTLCAASARQAELDERTRRVLGLFAQLIGQQLEREQLLVQLVAANARLTGDAATDALTGLPNRRALLDCLQQQLHAGERQNTTVLVGFLDLDGFKGINDQHGHAVGDALLLAMGQQLRQTLRAQDFVARYGGDEFAIVSPGPVAGPAADSAAHVLAKRAAQATVGRFSCLGVTIDYPGASAGAIAVEPGTMNATEALERADQLMYQVKQARKRALNA